MSPVPLRIQYHRCWIYILPINKLPNGTSINISTHYAYSNFQSNNSHPNLKPLDASNVQKANNSIPINP